MSGAVRPLIVGSQADVHTAAVTDACRGRDVDPVILDAESLAGTPFSYDDGPWVYGEEEFGSTRRKQRRG